MNILPLEEQMKRMKAPAVIVPLSEATATARMISDSPTKFRLVSGDHDTLHIGKCDVLDYGDGYAMWSASAGGGVLARSAEEAAIKWCAGKERKWHLLHNEPDTDNE